MRINLTALANFEKLETKFFGSLSRKKLLLIHCCNFAKPHSTKTKDQSDLVTYILKPIQESLNLMYIRYPYRCHMALLLAIY